MYINKILKHHNGQENIPSSLLNFQDKISSDIQEFFLSYLEVEEN